MMRALAAERWWGGVARAVAALAVLLCAGDAVAQTDPIKGSAALTPQTGFARLLLTLDDDNEPAVTVAGNIFVIRFKRKAEITLDAIATAAPDYVNAVRRDPDGLSIRFALSRKVTLNAMSAGERTYIDLLPETWSGPPPGLPAEVVRELAERARAAERALRQQRNAAAPKPRAQVRLRASQQPTFVRFSVDLPDGVNASAAVADRKLTLSFDAALNFDLAEAKALSPTKVTAIAPKSDAAASTIEMTLIGESEVRSFREDKAFVVDLVARRSDITEQIERVAAKPVASAPPAAEESSPPMPAGNIAEASSRAIAEAMKQQRASPRIAAPVIEKSPTSVAAPPQRDAALAEVKRETDALRIELPVPASVPTALLRRADKIWLVLDWDKPIDLAAIQSAGKGMIADTKMIPLDRAQAVRLRLKRPLLATLAADKGQTWLVTLADTAQPPAQPLTAMRNVQDPARASVAVALAGAGRLHRVIDPDDGEILQVVTALAPARAMVRRQDFVEFALLETVHGLAVESGVEDLAIDVMPDRIVLRRPGGLILSPGASASATNRASAGPRALFDSEQWQPNRNAPFVTRLSELMTALAGAAPADRVNARLDLARFYLARGFYPEAKGVLDNLAETETPKDQPEIPSLHALASLLAGHPALALSDIAKLSDDSREATLWTAMALAKQGKWSAARAKFRAANFALRDLPVELQRTALQLAALTSLETGDIADAAAKINDIELIGTADEMKPFVAVLRGRIAQSLGREDDALAEFRGAAASSNRQAASEARIFEMALRQKRGEPNSDEMLRDLETLAVTWRGDAIELKALQMLVRIYGKRGRFAEALAAARSATKLQPNSEVARQLQDDAAEMFTQLYLTSKGDAVPPIEALATFYENPELTPIGRRGDELIRRLADRLVAVDLLDQASELLQYQIDNRIEGAARSQIAAKLATVYLMNRKPQRAIAALHSSRIADLPGELRQERLLLEARAQSDIGRRDLALDIITNVDGREAIRLRSDIHWAARRWREASEQIELYLGDRWRDFTPLNAAEKSDVLRAAIGYALAEDGLGQGRFREKFAPLMSAGPDRAMLEIAMQPASASGADVAQVAKLAASVDTLDGFVRDMRVRFSDAMSARAKSADPEPTGALPQIFGSKRAQR